MAFAKVVLGILVVAAACFATSIEDSKGKTFPPFTIFDDHHGQYARVTGKSGRCNRCLEIPLEGKEKQDLTEITITRYKDNLLQWLCTVD